MIKLIPYKDSFEALILGYISKFFGFHVALTQDINLENSHFTTPTDESVSTLAEWQIPPNTLFIIDYEGIAAGFVRINYRGSNVAWIEDIFVDTPLRGRGIASSAVYAAENIIMNTPGYTSVCLEVMPRNTAALHLYHKLGYVDLSLITIRKEFGTSKRDRSIKLLDLDFKY